MNVKKNTSVFADTRMWSIALLALITTIYVSSFQILKDGPIFIPHAGVMARGYKYYSGLPLPYLVETVQEVPVLQNVSVASAYEIREGFIQVRDTTFSGYIFCMDWVMFWGIGLLIDEVYQRFRKSKSREAMK